MPYKKLRFVLVLTALLSGQAFAADFDISKKRSNVFNYNYIEAGIVSHNDVDADGFFFDASYDVDKNWNLFGVYQTVSGNNYESTTMQVGVGHHFKWYFTKPAKTHYLLKSLDLVALAGLEQNKTEFTINLPFGGDQTVSDTESGAFAGVKARKQMIPKVEVAVSHTMHSYYDGIFVLSVEGLYEVTKGLHLRLASEHYDNDFFVNLFDDDTISASVRYHF